MLIAYNLTLLIRDLLVYLGSYSKYSESLGPYYLNNLEFSISLVAYLTCILTANL